MDLMALQRDALKSSQARVIELTTKVAELTEKNKQLNNTFADWEKKCQQTQFALNQQILENKRLYQKLSEYEASKSKLELMLNNLNNE